MTHDELLAKVAEIDEYCEGGWHQSQIAIALRAVVELHKPDKFGFCYCSDIPSKCPTKEAIEKELK